MGAWETTEVALSDEEAVDIGRAGLVTVSLGARRGTWTLAAGSRVGVAVGEGWELRVRPRIEVPQLAFLLAYSRDPGGWKRLVAGFEQADELFAAIASGFSWQATWAVEPGVLRGYVRVEDRTSCVRGRVLFDRQVTRAGGLPLPVHLTYDEFTEDVPENRMLVTVARLLLRLPRVETHARRRLRRLLAVLDVVTPLSSWRGVRAPPITRLNRRYEAALRLAELVLDGVSIGTERGGVHSTTFIFDMNKVFEDFVSVALREAMRPFGGRVEEQGRSAYLDEGKGLPLKPDLTWWVGGTCAAVLDAKYKRIEYGGMPNADAYQMLAYCIAHRLPRGYLVYAADSGEEARTFRVRHTGHEIVVTTLDVRREPEDLLRDVASLAGRVSADREAFVLA